MTTKKKSKTTSAAEFDELNVYAWQRDFMLLQIGRNRARIAVLPKPDLNAMSHDRVDARMAVWGMPRLYVAKGLREAKDWIDTAVAERGGQP